MVIDQGALPWNVGCPLSPLLFAISIEPLAQLIRDDDNIKGVVINKEVHKLLLYVDDVLLYLTEPSSIIPHLKELIEFGYYLGYKVNVDKTEAMDVNDSIPQSVKVQSGFRWPEERNKYLGIYIPPSLQNLYDVNYSKIIQCINSDLE